MPDVGSALDDATAEAGRERGETLGRQDGSRVVLVSCGGRALRVVHSADDRNEGEGKGDRQIPERERQASQKREARPGKRNANSSPRAGGGGCKRIRDPEKAERVEDGHAEKDGHEDARQSPGQ